MSIISQHFNSVNYSIVVFCSMCVSSYWSDTKVNEKTKRSTAQISACSAIVSIIIFLTDRWSEFGYFPLTNLYESLLFLSCLLLIVYQFLESKIDNLLFGGIISPIILALISFAVFGLPLEMQKASTLVPALQSNWLMMHVSLMILSYSLLIPGSYLSILYFAFYIELDDFIRTIPQQVIVFTPESVIKVDHNIEFDELCERQIKASIKFRKDYISLLETWSFRSISLAFPFLTIGIITGAIWANDAWGSYWSWDPKETWALITWLNFAAYLHLRLIIKLNGRIPACLATLGFFVVWACYLGVNFFGQGLHSYGWFM